MTPYHERGGVVLYHGDCRDVLPTLERGSADLLLTDPPYGGGYATHGRRQVSFGSMANNDSPRVALAGIGAALRVLRAHRHLYVFGRFDLATLPLIGVRSELIWDKVVPNNGNVAGPWTNQHEYVQFGVRKHTPDPAVEDGRLTARLRQGTVLRVPRVNGGAVQRHPTEKPVLLLRQLIESSSRIGETVLDPFAGVGSTGVAALYEDRRAVLVEIEERYCEIAARRLDAAVLPLFEEASS